VSLICDKIGGLLFAIFFAEKNRRRRRYWGGREGSITRL